LFSKMRVTKKFMILENNRCSSHYKSDYFSTQIKNSPAITREFLD